MNFFLDSSDLFHLEFHSFFFFQLLLCDLAQILAARPHFVITILSSLFCFLSIHLIFHHILRYIHTFLISFFLLCHLLDSTRFISIHRIFRKTIKYHEATRTSEEIDVNRSNDFKQMTSDHSDEWMWREEKKKQHNKQRKKA